MPRSNNINYLKLRRVLREDWLTGGRRMSLVPLPDQRYLHDYFRPSEDLSDSSALEHRREITAAQPSLPHSAGRAWQHFLKPEPQVSEETRVGKHRLVAYPLIRPKPDLAKLSQALLELAARDLAEQAANDNITAAPMDDVARHQRFAALLARSRDRSHSAEPDEPDSSPRRRAG